MAKRFFLKLSIFTCLFTSCIEDVKLPKDTYRDNFETLWKIIDTRYCYLEAKNIDWNAVHEKYENRLGKDTLNKFIFFDAMAEMLATLQDGHVNLLSEFDRSRYWKWFTDYPANFSSSLIYSERYLGNSYRIAGGFRYRKIADGLVGYIYYSSFMDGFTDENIRLIFEQFQSCRGLIIDVRNNGGGSIEYASNLASCFFKRDTVNMYMRYKAGSGHNDFSKPVPIKTKAHGKIKWDRPVVVLSNRSSYSATNMFICQMKAAPEATILGDRSGGGGGMPFSRELPNGWSVRFSASPMYDKDMQDIEFGIEPDVQVNLLPEDREKGLDTLIEAALQIIIR